MGRRPVEEHLVEFFEQNKDAKVTVLEATRELHELGFKHWHVSVRDNLEILVQRGFLMRNDGRYYMSPDAMSVDLASETPTISPPELKHVDHCDRCGRKFKYGEVPHIRKFSNIKLYLCDDCNEQKKEVSAPIAPCLF